MAKFCQICNKPSGMYPLCNDHMKLKNEGKVVKNEELNKWEMVEETKLPLSNIQSDNENVDKICIVCGEPAPNGPQCKACYYETKEFKENLVDKNSRLQELNQYYYNLNGNLWRMSDFSKIKSNANKLFAIAMLTNDLFKSETLINKVQADIVKVIEKKKPQKKEIVTAFEKKQDSQQERLINTSDGHLVESQGERIIDDILYGAKIAHKYAPTVLEIDITDEPAVEADWFIPIDSSINGIYIEYWGMTTADYLKNKARKKEQYSKHNIPLIEVEKDEPNEDINSLTTRIIRELKKLAKDRFNKDIKF